jgi:high-affinity iron transporter
MHDRLSGARRHAVRATGLATAVLGGCVALAACGGARSASPAATGHRERISFDASSCASGWSAPSAGLYSFAVVNRSARSGSATLATFGSGVELGTASNVGPHATASVSARLLAGGDYEWSCEVTGAQARSSAVSAVGGSAPASVPIPAGLSTVQLIQPLAYYRLHVETLLATVRARVAALRARIAAGDLAGARAAWLRAHVAWLEIGQDDGAYGAFGALGGRIDGLAGGDAGGTSSRDFTGFHRIEQDLFTQADLRAAGRDARVTARLIGELTPAAVASALPPSIAGVDAWVLRCHEILEDALRDTLTGDDDYGSHSALATVAADVAATREMLHALAGLISPRAPQVVANGRRELGAVDAAIAAVRHGGATMPALTALSLRSRQRIDGAVGAAVETLAPVSELMQVQGGGT